MKKELDFVYITSAGNRYLNEIDALCAESQIQKSLESTERKQKKVMNIAKLLMDVLEKKNWGVYYKAEPLQTLLMMDNKSPLLRVNIVDEEALESAITETLRLQEKENCQESPQTNYPNLSQSKNSKTG